MERECGTAVIGGGVVGLSVARALSLRGFSVTVFEKEPALALHTSGRNSGVIHSGVFSRAGTLKAEIGKASVPRLFRYCEERGIPFGRVGKLVVAAGGAEVSSLEKIMENGRANGVEGLRMLTGREAKELEPNLECAAALHVPTAGVLDNVALINRLAEDLTAAGGRLNLSAEVGGLRRTGGIWRIRTARGEFTARRILNAAGLHADEVAWMCGRGKGYVIVPFRGDYFQLAPHRAGLVRGLIYPCKDPDLPFLGIHFTKTVSGGVLLGPNAVLAPGREGYDGFTPTPDFIRTVTDPGFIRMLLGNRGFQRTALRELRTSLSRSAFIRAARRMVPALRAEDAVRGRSGIRAQVVRRSDGALVEDLLVEEGEDEMHILNAVSPAMTNCFGFADHIMKRLAARGWN